MSRPELADAGRGAVVVVVPEMVMPPLFVASPDVDALNAGRYIRPGQRPGRSLPTRRILSREGRKIGRTKRCGDGGGLRPDRCCATLRRNQHQACRKRSLLCSRYDL